MMPRLMCRNCGKPGSMWTLSAGLLMGGPMFPCGNERHLLRHPAGDECHIAPEPVGFGGNHGAPGAKRLPTRGGVVVRSRASPPLPLFVSITRQPVRAPTSANRAF